MDTFLRRYTTYLLSAEWHNQPIQINDIKVERSWIEKYTVQFDQFNQIIQPVEIHVHQPYWRDHFHVCIFSCIADVVH